MPRYPRKIRYYTDVTEDFIGTGKAGRHGFDYTRDRRLGFKIGSFILYRLIATPIAFFHSALILRQRVKGREKLRGTHGVLLVLNHNERVGDAFTPSVVTYPRKTHVVVHPDNLALPVLGRLTAMLGAIPVPCDMKTARDFSRSLSDKLARGHVVAVYPEAHLWEKYTGIRPFADSAFDPAVKAGVPVFACTRVYLRRSVLGYVTRVYVDGPFYPDTTLSRSEACRDLSERVRAKMLERAGESDVEIIRYVKAEADNPSDA